MISWMLGLVVRARLRVWLAFFCLVSPDVRRARRDRGVGDWSPAHRAAWAAPIAYHALTTWLAQSTQERVLAWSDVDADRQFVFQEIARHASTQPAPVVLALLTHEQRLAMGWAEGLIGVQKAGFLVFCRFARDLSDWMARRRPASRLAAVVQLASDPHAQLPTRVLALAALDRLLARPAGV